MATSGKKKPDSKSGVFSSGIFLAFTAVAVVIAAIVVIMGRAGYTKDNLSPPAPSPSVASLPSQPATGNSNATPSMPVLLSGNSKGSLNAPVTIIEYSDFQCGICQHFALTTEKELAKAYVETGKVRFVYKHVIVYGESSMLAAQASECAAEQNKFWPYHDLLMQTQASPHEDDLPLSKLQSLAQQVGLDMATFNASLESGKYREKVAQEDAEGRSLGITGTPTFFVNGYKWAGAPSFETFQKLIDQALGGVAK